MDTKRSSLDSRKSIVEQQVSDMQDVSARISSLEKDVLFLRKSAEDLENRNRRNNIHLYGLLEGIEGGDPVSFFTSFLPKLLDLPAATSLNMQRVHRLGPYLSFSSTPSKACGVILLFLQFTDLLQVLNAAKIKKQLSWSKARLFLSQDVPTVTAKRRKEFLELRPGLCTLGARYGLFHLFLLKMTFQNHTSTFEEPADLRKFNHSHSAASMETAGSSFST